MALPMLPGYNFPDPSRQDFKKTQAFGFKNGHVVNHVNKQDLSHYDEFEPELPPISLLGPMGMSKSKADVKIDPYVPADVKYYKKVLRFDGFWKENVGGELRDRGATIHYFLEDDTIQVAEPKLPNSGIQHGTLLLRQRIPLDSTFAHTIPYQTTLNSVSAWGTNAATRTSPGKPRNVAAETGTFNKSVKGGVRDPNNYLAAVSSTNSPPPSRASPTLSRTSPTLTRGSPTLTRGSPTLTRGESPNGTRSASPPTNIYNTTTFNATTTTPTTNKGQPSFHWQDLGVGINVMFFGKEYTIVDADSFTREFYHDNGIELPTADALPATLSATQVAPSTRLLSHDVRSQEERYRLRKFLEHDRKVLRFSCVWDDTGTVYGERRPFILHYFLVDDTIELREVLGTNSGRDPSATFMKKQRLPKKPTSLNDMKTADHYTVPDLLIGNTINVFGRVFLIYDADSFTRQYYGDQYGITEFPVVQVEEQVREAVAREIPEYTGFGSEEDSLANCLSLVPKPPKKILKETRHNADEVMRFTAQLEEGKKGDDERRFVVAFFLEDDTFSIFETPIRGVLGGKFMERRKLKNPRTNAYYQPLDFFVGSLLEVHSHKFRLIDGDSFASQHILAHEHEYAEATASHTVDDVRRLASVLKVGLLRRSITSSVLSPASFRQSLTRAGLTLDNASFATLCRVFACNVPNVGGVDAGAFLKAME